MVEILHLQRWQRRETSRTWEETSSQDGKGAQILLFTGVRYEYLDGHEALKAAPRDAGGNGRS